MNEYPVTAAEQVFLIAAIAGILLLCISARQIMGLRPKPSQQANIWGRWLGVMVVAVIAILTLMGSAIAILSDQYITFLLLQSFFSVSTAACAVIGLSMLTRTLGSLSKELKRRKELEEIDRLHNTGMEKMILERTANLRQEIVERQKLTKQLLVQNKSMEAGLRLAGTLQRTLMPESIDYPHLKVSVQYHPMQMVSGDFYDRMDNEKGDVYIFCGDAMGHGTPAALFTFMLSAALRSANRNASPADILGHINRMLVGLNLELYATGVLARISRSGLLTICHAGHEASIIMPVQKDCKDVLKKSGFALGMFSDVLLPYENETYQMEAGDRLVLYTDGITEACDANGQDFGREKMKSVIREQAQQSVSQVSAEVIEALYDHVEDQPIRDDLTVMVIEYGSSHE